MLTTDWPLNTLRDLDRLTRKINNECHGKCRHESTQLFYLPPEEGRKGLMEIEALYKQTKINVAHYINTSGYTHIKLEKSFQKKNEDKNLKSVFKDAKRSADELQLSYHFNEEATVIIHDDQVTVVNTKEPKSIIEMLRKITEQKRRTEVMQQPWLGKYVSQHWKDAETTSLSYQIFKSRKNMPDIVLSVDTSIRQQLIDTKEYRKTKLQESVDETNGRLCSDGQETVPHLLCGWSKIPQTLYKDRHNRMLRPLYHSILEKFEFSESQLSLPWYKQSHPVPCLENEKAQVLWNIPWHLEKCPRNGANKPDISALDEVNKEWFIIEGTVCLPGTRPARIMFKRDKYGNLRIGVRSLYSGHKAV